MSHTAKSCNNKTRCLLCSGPHKKDQCRADYLKCANCAGEHTANSKECEYFSIGKKIEEVRVKQSLNYVDAKDVVLDKIKSHSINSQIPGPSTSFAQSQGQSSENSYRNKLIGPKLTTKVTPASNNVTHTTKDQSTQSDSKYDDDFFAKLTKCLLTVLGSLNSSQGQETLEKNIDKALRETFTPNLNLKRTRVDGDGTGTESHENSNLSEGDSEVSGEWLNPNLPKAPRNTRSRKKKKADTPKRGH